MTAGDGHGLRTEICRDGDEFGRLCERWASLYARCSTATPFQSHSWLHSWWVSYGRPGALRVVLVRREDGELAGAAPLMRARGPLPVLVPLGGAITDFTDVLLDDACPEAAPALARALARAARGAVVDLREVRPGAAAERVHACWRGSRRRLTDSLCLELPAVPMDALLERIPSGKAQRVRAKLRKLDALGIDEHIVTGEEVPAAVERLLQLHRLQWQGRGVTAEHTSDRFAQHLARAVRPMVERGDAMVTEFRLAGDVVAADLTLMSPRLAGGYLYGADPVLRARKVDVATMLLRHGARQTSASGRATLSMLRGAEPYKQHWRPETVHNQRLLLAGRGAAALLWLRAGAAYGRRWAARQARERAWVGRALGRARGRTNGGGG
ncbi:MULTISPECIES: GNAT family N-acetyltransferase [Streptomyces]|uniref:GNAT family N-acetyltransferase n=1 Tax=Streptomyces TaxID=1883 RepID=UPI0013198066|nr:MULTISPECIES: GNAT family N-acetyltransferase [Streptomyces]QGZ50671.1 GNAT family N-acetyltransferase [Streptomyces sp. QHH-9511]GGT83564.1 glycosyl transferase family 1 [Streptomyces lateritius]